MGNPANEYQPPSGAPPGQQTASFGQTGGPPIHQPQAFEQPSNYVPQQHQPQDQQQYAPPPTNQPSSNYVPQHTSDQTYYPPPPHDQKQDFPGQHQNPMAMHPPSQGYQGQEQYPTEQWVPSANQSHPQQDIPVQQGEQSHPAGKVSTLDKTKAEGKKAWDSLWNLGMKLGNPVNKWTNKIGSEAFWPSTMDKESDKAARILKSFCKDGFYSDPPPQQVTDGPKNKQKVLVKIPQKVIQNAVGLAIFSVMRTGLWVSGAGGSGVLISRLPDGSWSPPSGILIHTLGVGFMVGIDIYDCVLVINSYEALKAFSTFRVTLGTEVSVVAGPVGAGGILESDVRPNNRSASRDNKERVPTDPMSAELRQQQEKEKRSRKPVFTYMKSRGLYAGLQVDGTFILERNDENAKFYGERVGVDSILKGHVRNVPASTRMLMEVVKAAEGKQADPEMMSMASSAPPPSEANVEKTHEPTHEQKTAFAPDAETQKQMAAMTPPQHNSFPEYHPGDYENSDAALAARLQAEEDERAHAIASDIAPKQPPRPTNSEKSSAYVDAPPVASGAVGSSYPNEKSAAYPPPPPGGPVDQGESSKAPRPVSEQLPPYVEASGAHGSEYPKDVKGPPAPHYK